MYNTEEYKAVCKKKNDAIDGLNKLAQSHGAKDYFEIDYDQLENDSQRKSYEDFEGQLIQAKRDLERLHHEANA